MHSLYKQNHFYFVKCCSCLFNTLDTFYFFHFLILLLGLPNPPSRLFNSFYSSILTIFPFPFLLLLPPFISSILLILLLLPYADRLPNKLILL